MRKKTEGIHEMFKMENGWFIKKDLEASREEVERYARYAEQRRKAAEQKQEKFEKIRNLALKNKELIKYKQHLQFLKDSLEKHRSGKHQQEWFKLPNGVYINGRDYNNFYKVIQEELQHIQNVRQKIQKSKKDGHFFRNKRTTNRLKITQRSPITTKHNPIPIISLKQRKNSRNGTHQHKHINSPPKPKIAQLHPQNSKKAKKAKTVSFPLHKIRKTRNPAERQERLNPNRPSQQP